MTIKDDDKERIDALYSEDTKTALCTIPSQELIILIAHSNLMAAIGVLYRSGVNARTLHAMTNDAVDRVIDEISAETTGIVLPFNKKEH